MHEGERRPLLPNPHGQVQPDLTKTAPMRCLVLTPFVSVDARHWRAGAVTVSRRSVALRWWGRGRGWVSVSTEAARPWFTVTAAPGMWGQQARRARLLPLIFICSTVCLAFKSLAEREALDTPWMARGPHPLFKDPGSFFKAKGIRDRRGMMFWIGPRGLPATQD